MSDAAYLDAYRKQNYPSPSVTVDLVIFTVVDGTLQLLLIERAEPPFVGASALPGGFVRVGDTFDERGESLDAAAHRELAEETGLPEGSCYLEQIGAFGAPDRDPRKRIISIAYTALCRPDLAPSVVGGSDASAAGWVAIDALPDLAFDHDAIIAAALRWIRDRLDRSSIAFSLVPERFTIAELRTVYEAILGEPQDPGNFRRKFKRLEADGMLAVTDGKRPTGTKPASLYRFVR